MTQGTPYDMYKQMGGLIPVIEDDSQICCSIDITGNHEAAGKQGNNKLPKTAPMYVDNRPADPDQACTRCK